MSRTRFEQDPYPGRPRILFVGASESTHTHAWIDLLEDSDMNVRLFALPSGLPPENWSVRSYITAYAHPSLESSTRACLYSSNRQLRFLKRAAAHASKADLEELNERWFAKVINDWRPDIIHTLGMHPAALFYYKVRERYRLERVGKWVVQVRGGPDLALYRLLAEYAARIRGVLSQCDKLIADNQQNYDFALELGLQEQQLASLGVVPGTGGIDVERLSGLGQAKPSRRRMVLWPKAYDSLQNKALPILEGLRLAWERIQPCEIKALMAFGETTIWFQTLPEDLRRHCTMSEKVPRAEVLQMMSEARVMLAPAISDGIPNSMYEAMAAGAFPIVSPLETITPLVQNERNVLFARNLYPQQIADALTRAMNDDTLVDEAAERNLSLVSRIADRNKIRPRVIDFYESLAES